MGPVYEENRRKFETGPAAERCHELADPAPKVNAVNLIIRLLINAAALWVAAEVVPGINFEDGSAISILLVALVFGLVNAFLKPIFKIFTFPVIILSLGLFALVINTALLGITAALMADLTIDGFWAAFLGALLISIVSAVLDRVLGDKD